MIRVQIASLISSALLSGDFSNHFSKLPSALDCEQPIVVAEGAYQRESRIEGEERGRVPVTVMVVRDVASEAEGVAAACERWLRGCSWERDAEAGGWRIAGIDIEAPRFKERDSSGRYVWEFTVDVTAVRSV